MPTRTDRERVKVRDEIIQRLHMRDSRTIVRGFDRPNIWLGVETFPTAQAKRKAVIDSIAEAERPGIVYVSIRRHAEELAGALAGEGVKAVFYHGGINAKERTQIQQEFMNGDADVIVATNAFGMGIDKPDVRFVYHHDISDSLDSYYQEIGRAGRDGKPAEAVLFYRPEDLSVHKFLSGAGKLDADAVERIANAIREKGKPVDPTGLRGETGLSKTKIAQALNRLEEAGAIERLPTGEVRLAGAATDLHAAAEAASRAQQRRKEWLALRIEKMRAYAELQGCRRAYLINHFGEEFEGPCGYCDNCAAGVTEETGADTSVPFAPKSRVVHKQWGKGMVESFEGDRVVVLFDKAGRKTMDIGTVVGRGLLQRAA